MSQRESTNKISIRYRFTLGDGTREVFDLRLDPENFTLISEPPEVIPEWAQLDTHQCGHCPFSTAEHNYCHVAVNLIEIVNRFERLASYARLFVEVMTFERNYSKRTSAQRGISSLMGVMIGASRCPYTDFFKPMVRFHLPFATPEDTIWRATSTYMLAQYFMNREGRPVDFEMKGLNRMYKDIQKMNISLARRLRDACEMDSTVNAVIILDVFARSLPSVIDHSLDKLRPVFEPVLRRW